ncbi:hypothetical protein LTR16_001012 [Cryomyces antarcticus]|uniref:Calcipressin n=1 Tax=Cryomyces antarcticus TaxID=329879 RepID=A0ABR0KU88_9PEZI|nr:hypothetical protein LTR60_000475 [Cryomyces antarcticus]KAK5131120.1 hypothetical protein LTR16_001012 [Cryomyces antarcticus]
MAAQMSSPPHSRTSSHSSSKPRTPLSLDFSDLPPLTQPSPPSNTLLITNLQDPRIFLPSNLLTIRDLINTHAPIHTWAPLKSFRRIVVSFYSTEAGTAIRQLLDGEAILGDRVRVYFAEPTPVEPVDQHLHAPKSAKLFFISPPPSPPHGWELRDEAPPNKEVHAEDLASALARLHARPDPAASIAAHADEPATPTSPTAADINIDNGYRSHPHASAMAAGPAALDASATRRRSGSSHIVYHPGDHGDSPMLPAIAVEDTTGSGEETSALAEEEPLRFARTGRPPVELMR